MLIDGTLQNGTLLIGFERNHRIDRYPIRDGAVLAPDGALKLPPEAKRMQPNQGIEALTVLKGGRHKGSVVAFAERFTRGSGYHTGWIWVRGEPQRLQLKDIDGFNITGAAGLPDGGLLVLERYFRWTEGVKMRLRRIATSEIAPGARITGTTLFQADFGLRDRQHGRHCGACRRRRRDRRLADLRQQLQSPAAAHGIPAVHVARRGAEERGAAEDVRWAKPVATSASVTCSSRAISAWWCTCTG